jgi:uncharacterized membrane protein YqhA
VIPVIFLLATVFLLVSMLTSTPVRCLWGMVMILVGLPVYSIFARRLPPDDDPEAWIGAE